MGFVEEKYEFLQKVFNSSWWDWTDGQDLEQNKGNARIPHFYHNYKSETYSPFFLGMGPRASVMNQMKYTELNWNHWTGCRRTWRQAWILVTCDNDQHAGRGTKERNGCYLWNTSVSSEVVQGTPFPRITGLTMHPSIWILGGRGNSFSLDVWSVTDGWPGDADWWRLGKTE